MDNENFVLEYDVADRQHYLMLYKNKVEIMFVEISDMQAYRLKKWGIIQNQIEE